MALTLHTGVIAFSSKNAILTANYTGQYKGQWVYANDTQEYFYVKTNGELSGALTTFKNNGGLAIKIDDSVGFALQVTDHENKPILKLLSNYDLEVYGSLIFKAKADNTYGNNYNETDYYVLDNAAVFSVDDTVIDSHIDITFDIELDAEKQDILMEIKGAIPAIASGLPRLFTATAYGTFDNTGVLVSDIYDQFDISGAITITWEVIDELDENNNIIKRPVLRITNTAGNIGNSIISNIKLYKGFYKKDNDNSILRVKDIHTHNNTPSS